MRDIVQIFIEVVNPYLQIVRYSDAPDEPDIPVEPEEPGVPQIMRWIVYDGFKYILDFDHPINFAHRLPTDLFNSIEGVYGWLTLDHDGYYDLTFSQPIHFYQGVTF